MSHTVSKNMYIKLLHTKLSDAGIFHIAVIIANIKLDTTIIKET